MKPTSRCYCFYKECEDEESFDSANYSGLPLFGNYNLEERNLNCETCEEKGRKNELTCYGCFLDMCTRYKINRSDIPVLTEEMVHNKHLFNDLLTKIKQEYMWVEVT